MLSERLLKLREQSKLSQKEMSVRLGIARTTYASYEQGKREPDIEMLIKLSSFFEVDITWLVTGKNKNIETELEVEELLHTISKLNKEDQKHIEDLAKRLSKED